MGPMAGADTFVRVGTRNLARAIPDERDARVVAAIHIKFRI